MIKGFLFDLDGTIWDSKDAFAEALTRTIESQKGKRVDRKTLLNLFSSSTPLEILRLYRIDRTDFFWKQYKESYSLIKLFFRNTLFILQQAKRCKKKMGIVTSLKKEIAMDILARFDLTSIFSVIVTPSDTSARKPSPKPLMKAIDQLGLSENEVLYIGDQEIDMVAARRAGCHSALAKWGNIERVNTEPEYQLGELADILVFCGD
jgi:HAD superfamily hydrolase (TIGR01549 family)